ncbi:MAG: glycosyltransferase family 39 protein [Candidatus Nitrosopelagicus sp.]|nr:glycosyltransferase family 39 protein [Candidatus Nitrosopelagicus sp.]
MSELNIQQEISNKSIVCCLIGIIFIGLIIRFFYFPYEIPVSLDSSYYFSYAYELAKIGEFPNFHLANNGWPTFLALFFKMLSVGEFQQFIDLQRAVSIILSVITIIPMYFLCRKFFPKIISIIGGALFILEPRVISNSILGITEPFFNLLIITSLVIFFSKKNLIYFSFAILALAVIVRYEGILLIIPYSIMFFVKFRKNRKIIIKYLLCIGIFILILYPMMMIRTETMGADGVFSHVSGAMNAIFKHSIQGVPHETPNVKDFPGERNTFRLHNFLGDAFSSMFFSLGLIQIPIFILFFPLGIFFVLRKDRIKNMNYKHVTLILFVVFASLTMLYAHGRGIMEIRYYLILYPIIILICCYGIEKIKNKIPSKILLGLILSFIIIVTFSYLEYDKIDYEFEKEAFEITSIAINMSDRINAGSLHGGYITTASMIEKWPELKKMDAAKNKKISPVTICKDSLSPPLSAIVCKMGSSSLHEFIIQHKKDGLDHIVVDNLEHGPEFIQDVFYNEEKYPYLDKVFDSKAEGYTYYVKIFKINFEEFEEIIEK